MPAPARKPPTVFISYSRDSQEHMDRVLELADRLRSDGVDAEIDQYESAIPEGLQVWMERQIRESDFVLVVSTSTYRKRVEHREEPGKGYGVMWEINLIFGEIYQAGLKNEKVIAVVLGGCGIECIPAPLQNWPYYDCSNDQGYFELFRRLTGQPYITKPELGELKALPQRQRREVRQEERKARPPQGKPWNVPQERNPLFTGREELLTDLRADLVKNGRQALSAMGGMGKTQTAIEYAYRHRDDYQAVLWTFADTEQAISSGLAKIASADFLDLPEKDSAEQDVVVAAVRRWLEQHEGWLLVFDNADQPELLRKFLPNPQRGHILLTSRAQVFQSIGIIKPREVSVLAPAAAHEFLLKRTGQDPNTKSPDANALAKELGCYPLALEQAGAYMVENQARFSSYLAGFQARRLKLFEKQKAVIGDYEKTVTTTWDLNFAEIEKNASSSADLLRLSAFLSPDAIPLELLEKGKGEMGERISASFADLLAIDELLQPLRCYSLIRRDQEQRTYSIHVMVQEVIRHRMPMEEQKTWVGRSVRAVDETFPDIEFVNWPKCERLLPHVLACTSWVDSFGLRFEQPARLLNRTSHYLVERGRYPEAEPLARLALAIREKVLGPEHPHTAQSLGTLAVICYQLNNREDAERLNKRALKINEQALGQDHPDTAVVLNNLARIYNDQGKYEQAEPLYALSLDIVERVLGPEHPDMPIRLNNLACLYHDQGKYGKAEPLYRRALSICEKVLEAEHPDKAKILNNLAELYRHQGKYIQAEPLYERAVAIAEKSLGPRHPEARVYAHNFIFFCRTQGKHAEANALEQRFPDTAGST